MLSKILKLVSVLFLSVATTQAQNVKPNQSGEPIATTSSTAKIFMVLDITVHDTAMYEQYRINVEPIIKKLCGNCLWKLCRVYNELVVRFCLGYFIQCCVDKYCC